MKQIAWIADSLERLREFPADAKHDAGYQLEKVQEGLAPSDWKPMPSIGPGVNELRVRAGGAFRVIYVARFIEAIYVLHVFQKKEQKTRWSDIEAARRRFRALIAQRRET